MLRRLSRSLKGSAPLCSYLGILMLRYSEGSMRLEYLYVSRVRLLMPCVCMNFSGHACMFSMRHACRTTRTFCFFDSATAVAFVAGNASFEKCLCIHTAKRNCTLSRDNCMCIRAHKHACILVQLHHLCSF